MKTFFFPPADHISTLQILSNSPRTAQRYYVKLWVCHEGSKGEGPGPTQSTSTAYSKGSRHPPRSARQGSSLPAPQPRAGGGPEELRPLASLAGRLLSSPSLLPAPSLQTVPGPACRICPTDRRGLWLQVGVVGLRGAGKGGPA